MYFHYFIYAEIRILNSSIFAFATDVSKKLPFLFVNRRQASHLTF